MLATQFRVLGEIEAFRGSERLGIGHRRQRCVLAVLLVEANRPISADLLIDWVWGSRRPPRVRDTLYGYISAIRRALSDLDFRLERGPGGYTAIVDPQSIDLHRFTQLVAAARRCDDDQQALELFDQALVLWKGPVLGSAPDTPWIGAARDRFENERAQAQSQRIDLALRCGLHQELLPELTLAANERPLDERLAGQLILALAQNGLNAAAFEHFQQIRHMLAEELGVDPCPELQQLYVNVLRGGITVAETRMEKPPRQLPAGPDLFVGRRSELAALDAALRKHENLPTAMISTVIGAGGIGKTWLALRWAYSRTDQFPDGQLYLDLRGFHPTAEPITPVAALWSLLTSLGIDPALIATADERELAGLYRSAIAGKKILILLDNARDTTQVTPLLPGTGPAAVLVTSRNRLTALTARHDATAISMHKLASNEAVSLLGTRLGRHRLESEPGAIDDLVHACDGLPLALGVIAAHAATHPGLTLSTIARDVAAAGLDAWDTDDLTAGVRAVLESSLRAQKPSTRLAFELLGRSPAADLSLPAIAALIGQPPRVASAALRELDAHHLIERLNPDRYRVHDLARLYAGELASQDQSALRRLLDYFVAAAAASDALIEAPKISYCYGVTAPVHPPLGMAWFQAERFNLPLIQHAAMSSHESRSAFELSWATNSYFRRAGFRDDGLTMAEVAVRASYAMNNPIVVAMARLNLGDAFAEGGRHDAATKQYDTACQTFASLGNLEGESQALFAMARNNIRRRRFLPARDYAERAYTIFRIMRDPKAVAQALNALAWCNGHLGQLDSAQQQSEQALRLSRRHGLAPQRILHTLGFVRLRVGRVDDALSVLDESLTASRTHNDLMLEATCLMTMGDAHMARHDLAEARKAWTEALIRFQQGQRTSEIIQAQSRLWFVARNAL